MKGRIALLFLTVLPICLKAQNTFPLSGNVGIGTTNPLNKLDVIGNISNGGGDFYLGKNDGRNQGLIPWNRALVHSDWGIGTDNLVVNFSGDFEGGVNIQGPQVILDGSVGVGTSAIAAKFNVALQNPAGWSGNLNAVRLSSPDNAYYLDIKSYIVQSGNVGYDFSPNGNSALVITTPGNVGIGTTTPDSKLTVKGNIHTQEVKVDLLGSVAPDYVFEKDYPLTSLEELKSYIDQNKHLPEIPSAKEMEEEGINLKEMNLLLLKKVEELTLYVIEQNEELILQGKLIRDQNARLSKLGNSERQ